MSIHRLEDEKKITFVIGAGASCPYLYPCGEGLLDRVIEHHANDIEFNNSLKLLGFEADRVSKFIDAIRGAGSYTIDQFLKDRKDLRDVGYAAISYIISLCERVDPVKHVAKAGDWLRLFCQEELFKNVESLASGRIRIVTFNYDRLIEYRLSVALKDRFNLSAESVVDLIDKLDVVHVHGSIGRLSGHGGSSESIYGIPVNDNLHQLRAAFESMRLAWDEGGTPGERAAKYVKDSDIVIFLGFAFARENLEKIGLGDERDNPAQAMYGSCFNLEDTIVGRLAYDFPELVLAPKEWDAYQTLDHILRRNGLQTIRHRSVLQRYSIRRHQVLKRYVDVDIEMLLQHGEDTVFSVDEVISANVSFESPKDVENILMYWRGEGILSSSDHGQYSFTKTGLNVFLAVT